MGLAVAKIGIDAWLRNAPLTGSSVGHTALLNNAVVRKSSQGSPVHTARQDLHDGIKRILGKSTEVCYSK